MVAFDFTLAVFDRRLMGVGITIGPGRRPLKQPPRGLSARSTTRPLPGKPRPSAGNRDFVSDCARPVFGLHHQ